LEITGYFEEGQLVREKESHLVLTVTNIGNEIFTGGKLKSVRLFFTHPYDCGPTVPILPEIAPIGPMSSWILSPIPFKPYADGPATLIVGVEANDGQPVELYSVRRKRMPRDWLAPLYVLNREHVQIISLLEQVVRLLKPSQGKRRKGRRPRSETGL
jgi:hypothetical protein